MTYLEGYAAGLRSAIANRDVAGKMLDLAEQQLALQNGQAQHAAVDTNVVDDGYGPREASR